MPFEVVWIDSPVDGVVNSSPFRAHSRSSLDFGYYCRDFEIIAGFDFDPSVERLLRTQLQYGRGNVAVGIHKSCLGLL